MNAQDKLFLAMLPGAGSLGPQAPMQESPEELCSCRRGFPGSWGALCLHLRPQHLSQRLEKLHAGHPHTDREEMVAYEEP